MTEPMPNEELRRTAAQFIDLRAKSRARAWPILGRDATLAEEAGPAGFLLFTCRTSPAMANPLGIVHGGITAALVDTCMGVTCSAQCGRAATPTVTMTVNYARPVPLDADIRVRVRTVRIGSSTAQMSAEVFLPQRPDELLASASAVYAIKRSTPQAGEA